MASKRFIAILPAAGSGTRMGLDIPKVLLPLAENRPVLAVTLDPFLSIMKFDTIIVTAPEDLISDFKILCDTVSKPYNIQIDVIPGGSSRRESVYKALQHASSGVGDKTDAYVIVHDAARPFLSKELLAKVLIEVESKNAVTVAIPQVDSVKEVNSEGMVDKSLNRELLWSVQTPQAFRLDLLLEGHLSGSDNATDDSVLVETIHPVSVVSGEDKNIKLTTRDDYDYACYLQGRKTGISRPS